MKIEQHEIRISPDLEGQRLDSALARILNQYSRSTLKRWIENGDAQLNGEIVRPRTRVSSGDRVIVDAKLEANETITPQAVDFTVVFEDESLIVIDKPAGLVVHPGAGNPDQTLVNGLLNLFPELSVLPRAGLVHRIDKGTTGLLLAARNIESHHALVAALADREITRQYVAVCNGKLISGATIESPIGRDPRNRKRMWVVASGRPAITHYRVRQQFARQTMLEVTLETGRTHQIRVHLAAQGNPLVGDTLYGARPMPPPAADNELRDCITRFPRPALHAAKLAFAHPLTGAPMEFQCDIPADFAALVERLSAHVNSLNSPK